MVLELVVFVVGVYLGALAMQRLSSDLPDIPGPVSLAVRAREFFTLSLDEWKTRYGGKGRRK